MDSVTSTPSTTLPSIGQNKHFGNIVLYGTSLISIMVSHFDCIHKCYVEKNAYVAFILSSRLQNGAESLGIDTIMICV